MNTNGGGIRQNEDDGHHTDPQHVRQRGNQRRSRGRQNYERPMNGRGNRDRRSQNWRDAPNSNLSSYSSPQVPAVIDVDDDVQFPSITGAPSGDSRRNRSQTIPQTSSTTQQQPMQNSEYGPVSNTQRSNYSSYQSEGYAYSGQSRYNVNNRGRGSRYQQQGRGYQNTSSYNRRPNNNRPAVPSMYGLSAVQYVPTEPYSRQSQGTTEQNREKPEIDCVQQVEYYFSDTNLVTDQYLRSQMDDEGYVDLKLIHSFKRISNLNLPFEEFVEKLKGSDKLDLHSDGTRVRAKKDHEKWVGFTRFLRERNVGDMQSHEFTKLYVSYMKRTYGPQTYIPPHLLNPPPPKPKSAPAAQYVPSQYPILPYVEPVHGSVPYYAFTPGDPSLMYSIGNPYQFQFTNPYQEYAMDYNQIYYPDPNYYTDQYASQERFDAPVGDAVSGGNVDTITNMVSSLKIDDLQTSNEQNST